MLSKKDNKTSKIRKMMSNRKKKLKKLKKLKKTKLMKMNKKKLIPSMILSAKRLFKLKDKDLEIKKRK
jgi:hypothetical protein